MAMTNGFTQEEWPGNQDGHLERQSSKKDEIQEVFNKIWKSFRCIDAVAKNSSSSQLKIHHF